MAGNVNCTIAVTRSACLFALRVLLPPDVPANAGAFAPLDIRVRRRARSSTRRRPSAVVAGNVETSQRMADTVLAALAQLVDGLPAQGQGTMNNVVHRRRGLDLLRDDRRRAGRRRRTARARRACTSA